MRTKVDFYGEIQGETGVIMAFSKIHEGLGFGKLIPSSSKGFDIDSIEFRGTEVTVEFEYLSSSFITHGHPAKMDSNRKYVVICWEDDCGLMSKLNDEYKKKLHEVIAIRKYVNIIKETSPVRSSKSSEEPQYAVMSYNPRNAGGMDFSAWAFSHCYRIQTSKKHPIFANNHLPPGSKVLFSQKGFIVGGFTVVRYEIIERPRTERELKLYKTLTDYPNSLFTVSIEKYKKDYVWLRGHIFYTDFFDWSDFKIKLSRFVKKAMPRHGKLNLTRDQYFRILGH